MALFPLFYAVIENDLRRVLCYSKINQIGFMVVAIGIGTELAIDGAIAHAFNHVLYKSLLFMCLGAVIFERERFGLPTSVVFTRKCLGLQGFVSSDRLPYPFLCSVVLSVNRLSSLKRLRMATSSSGLFYYSHLRVSFIRQVSKFHILHFSPKTGASKRKRLSKHVIGDGFRFFPLHIYWVQSTVAVWVTTQWGRRI